jgi:dCTP deaminase
MILCNTEIHRALDDWRLVITPEPRPRRPTPGQVCPYDTHTVDLRLGSPIRIPKAGPYDFNLAGPDLSQFLTANSTHIDLAGHGTFRLEPRKFVLGITFESITLPIKRRAKACLAARIEGKSSRARCGLLVHFTAPTVHPGWEGPLALEIINLGPSAIILTHEMFIAQLIVEEVKGSPFHNASQFHRQRDPTGARD